MTKRVAVVIPYFQREAGILQRALRSVVAQDLPSDVELRVVVVDDASPHPAAAELEALAAPADFRVKLLHRANGGPGAARNTALDSLDVDETDFVAFLDSDDTWAPNHIADALQAMGEDSDFYFCDHTRFDINVTWFDQVILWRKTEQRDFLPLSLAEGHHSVPGRIMLQGLVLEYLSQTSTVIYRFKPHCKIRFDPALRQAGEDQLFFMMVCQSSKNAAYATQSNVHCGRGENVWFGNFHWSAPDAADRYAYITILHSKICKIFDLNSEVRAYSQRALAYNVEIYHYLAFRNLLRGHRPSFSLAAHLIMLEPLRMALFPIHFVRTLVSKKG